MRRDHPGFSGHQRDHLCALHNRAGRPELPHQREGDGSAAIDHKLEMSRVELPPVRPVTAFKYVENEFVERVQAGAIRIGTFRDYADSLHEKRADPLEGIVRYELNHAFGAHDEDRVAKANLAKIGVHIEAENIGFAGIVVQGTLPNLYCLCFSKSYPNDHLAAQKEQQVFHVPDIAALAFAISRQDARLTQFKIAEVKYRLRPYDPFDPDALLPDGFIKDVQFAPEDEIRIVWRMDNELDRPFCLKPNLDVATNLFLL